MKPTIIIAISEFGRENAKYLRNLNRELMEITNALKPLQENNLIQIESIPAVNLDLLFDLFHDSEKKIIGFHFAGHGDQQEILFDQYINGEKFSNFLGKQNDLQWVFLNSCSSKSYTKKLIDQNINLIISTSRNILDSVACEFAISFYKQLVKNKSIKESFEFYPSKKEIIHTSPLLLYRDLKQKSNLITRYWPWEIDFKPGTDKILNWKISDIIDNPLWGLPDISFDYILPNNPFRFLQRYEREHAEVFFGREVEIRDIYEFIFDDSNTSSCLLLYGQSGVGKSSLIEAGIVPRIEKDYSVQYYRWSLSINFENIFHDAKNTLSNNKFNQSIIIIDQLEEIIIKNRLGEFKTFLRRISNYLSGKISDTKVKLILSFRKEFFAEFNDLLSNVYISTKKYFISPLMRSNIQKAIHGIPRSRKLMSKYNLIIEDGLAEKISSYLFLDSQSVISPIFQLLLSKMWQKASKKDPSRPIFSINIFNECKKEGVFIRDFLVNTIKTVENEIPRIKESGLAIDLLNHFTTNYNSSHQHTYKEIVERYRHIDKNLILFPLLDCLKNNYLIIDSYDIKNNENVSLRLVHDSLAGPIRDEFLSSDQPGPIAARILDNNKELQGYPSLSLNEDMLALIENGREGMRSLNNVEETILRYNKEKIQKNKKQKRRRINTLKILGTALIISFSVLYYQEIFHKENERKHSSNIFAANSIQALNKDPTLAIDFAKKAYLLNKSNSLAIGAVISSFYYQIFQWNGKTYSTPFYKKIGGENDIVYNSDFSSNGQYIISSCRDNSITLRKITGKLIFKKRFEFQTYSAFFSNNDQFIIASSGNFSKVFDLSGKEIHRTDYAEHEEQVSWANFSPNGSLIATISKNGEFKLIDWNNKKVIFSHLYHEKLIWGDFSSNGNKIAICGDNGIANIFDTKTFQKVSIPIPNSKSVKMVRFSPSGEFILTTLYEKVLEWDLNKISIVRTINNKINYCSNYSVDGNIIYTANTDNEVAFYHKNSNAKKNSDKILEIKGGIQGYTYAHLDNALNHIVTSGVDGSILLFDITANRIPTFQMKDSNAVNFVIQSDNNKILCSSNRRKIYTLDSNLIKNDSIRIKIKNVSNLELSHKNSRLLAYGDNQALIWELPSLKLINKIAPKHEMSFTGFFNRIGDIYSIHPTTICVWDKNGNPKFDLSTFPYHLEKITTSDYEHIVAADYTGNLFLIKDKSIKPISKFKNRSQVISLEFLSGTNQFISIWEQGYLLTDFDGINDSLRQVLNPNITNFESDINFPYFIMGSEDGSLTLYDNKANRIGIIRGHNFPIHELRFSKNKIFSSSKEGNIKAWTLNPDVLLNNLK